MAKQKVTCSFSEYVQLIQPAMHSVSDGLMEFEEILNIEIEIHFTPCLGEKWEWLFRQLSSPYGLTILKAHQAKYGVSDWQNNTQKMNSN